MKRLFALALTLSVLLVLVACSGDAASTGTTPADTTTPASNTPSTMSLNGLFGQKQEETDPTETISRPSTEPSPSGAANITDYLDTSHGIPVEQEPDYSFEAGNVQAMCEAMAAWEGWRRGNKPSHVQREFFAEMVEENYDYQGETCFRLETYEFAEDGSKNRLTEMKVPITATDLNEAWFTDLNDHLPMAYEEEDDAATSELMTRAGGMLEQDFPEGEFSIGYAGMGSQKVYIDDHTYFEINIYDAGMDETWFLVLSTEAEEAYVHMDGEDYYYPYPF